MKRKVIYKEDVCSQIFLKNPCESHKRDNLKGGLFCLECPDSGRIPKDCTGVCGAPIYINAGVCPYEDDCPCATPDTPERAEAIREFYMKKEVINAQRAVVREVRADR